MVSEINEFIILVQQNIKVPIFCPWVAHTVPNALCFTSNWGNEALSSSISSKTNYHFDFFLLTTVYTAAMRCHNGKTGLATVLLLIVCPKQ